ncbi:MAG: peptidylprolyl isomerase [Pseudobdellovibrionaceae bacterium]
MMTRNNLPSTFFLTLTLWLGFALWPATAATKAESIAAVVNHGVVTISDVNARLTLIAKTTGMPESKELMNKLRPQILDSLIEEQLRTQEAERLGLAVEEKEIDNGFSQIAKQNNIPPDTFRKMLGQQGISISTMRDQIKAQIAWQKIIQKRIRPRVNVTDSDIDTELESLKGKINTDQYKLAEIYLPVLDIKQSGQVRSTAQNIFDQLQVTPQAFGKYAKEFSASPGAAQGGLIGWITAGQLPEELDKALPTLVKDKVAAPIQTKTGYYILLLLDKRRLEAGKMPTRDEITEKIGVGRMERAARKYLIDLRAAAFIEKRV